MQSKEIKLSNWSKEFLKKNFENGIYVGCGDKKQTPGSFKDFEGIMDSLVIHLYPVADTVKNNEGEVVKHTDPAPDSVGVQDGLLSMAVVYNNDNNKYIIEECVDIVMSTGAIGNTYVYKDGSTVMSFAHCEYVRVGSAILVKPGRAKSNACHDICNCKSY